jgi:hypothetical protein
VWSTAARSGERLEDKERVDTTNLPGKGYDDPFNVQISVVQVSAGEAMIIEDL